jgi:hypothetical protein
MLTATRRILTTMMAAAAVAGAAAAPAVSSQDTNFRGHFVVVETTTPDPLCGGLRISHTGSGSATHLGNATWSATECVDLLAHPGRSHVRDGRAVLTSANGETLHLSYEADGALPDPAGNVHVTGPYVITGGTGRFDAAKGGGTLTGDANVNTAIAQIDLTGTLPLAH